MGTPGLDGGDGEGNEEYDPPRNPCDNPSGPYETTDVNFMKDHWNDATRIAAGVGLTAEFIMGWASLESYNSSANALGDAATKNNNFFGLTYRSDKSETVWKDSILCPAGSYDGIRGPGGHSCFNADNAFFVSGMSALTSFGNRYGSAATIAAGEYGSSDLYQIGYAIASSGYNPGGASTYGKAIASRWNRLSTYMDCVH